MFDVCITNLYGYLIHGILRGWSQAELTRGKQLCVQTLKVSMT